MAQSLDIRETHAFKTAVSEEVAKHTETLASQVAELRALIEKQQAAAIAATPQAGVELGLKAIMENLGMTLADVAAQGIGVQKPIPPEVLRAREEAHRLMVQRIKRAKRDGEIPKYRVVAITQADFGRSGQALVQPFWVDSDKVRQPTEIEWPGVPNNSLMPLNDVAKEIMAHFKDSIGNMGRLTPSEELKGIGTAKVRGNAESKARRDAPMPFDVAPDEDGVRVLNRSARGQSRRVNILGTLSEPAEVSG
jgi:hypothetical protein